MQIPDDAIVKPYVDAAPRSLLVGRFRDEEVNFVAIRTEARRPEGVTPSILVLPPRQDDPDAPNLSRQFLPSKVLDLGTDWSIDVPVGGEEPTFHPSYVGAVPVPHAGDAPEPFLIRSGTEFFIGTRQQGFLNLANGVVFSDLPDRNNIAAWFAFSIRLPQPDEPGPGAVVYRWPVEPAE